MLARTFFRRSAPLTWVLYARQPSTLPQTSQFPPPVTVCKTESALPFPTASRQWYTTLQQREAAINSDLGAHFVSLRVKIDVLQGPQERHLNEKLARQDQRALATAQTKARRYCANMRAELQPLQNEVPYTRPHRRSSRLFPGQAPAGVLAAANFDSDARIHISDVDEPDAETTANNRYGEIARRGAPLGPAVPGLPELEPGDPRFRGLLSYRLYRLLKRSAHLGPDTSRDIGVWGRRLEHSMLRHTFDGRRTVACLRFLSAFERQLDNERVPEAAAFNIWPRFLSGDALDLFNQQTEDGDAEIGRFSTWRAAVQFFLCTYATDEHI